MCCLTEIQILHRHDKAKRTTKIFEQFSCWAKHIVIVDIFCHFLELQSFCYFFMLFPSLNLPGIKSWLGWFNSTLNCNLFMFMFTSTIKSAKNNFQLLLGLENCGWQISYFHLPWAHPSSKCFGFCKKNNLHQKKTVKKKFKSYQNLDIYLININNKSINVQTHYETKEGKISKHKKVKL